MSGLFSGLFAHGPAAAEVSDRALLNAMVEVEAALVRALVKTGLAPAEAERDLDRIADANALDLDLIGRSTADTGTPIPALLSALRERLGDSPAAEALHHGATSQDIVDTAIMLVAGRALKAITAELDAAVDACATLAEQHRHTALAGRTLLQQAVPTTFGLKAAGWLSSLDDARRGLRTTRLALQFGGAVGTLAALHDRGLEVASSLAEELGLSEPALPWHTARVRTARLACELGLVLGTMGKIGRDVALLAQTEVAEVREGGGEDRGGSSTMPHKRNPVGAVAVLACARRGPGLVATILGAMDQEHERGAGGWQAEWEPLLELLRLTGSAAASLNELIADLDLDTARMRDNLELTHGLVMSEAVAAVLADALGRAKARELLDQAAKQATQARKDLGEVLLGLPEVTGAVEPDALRRALDPANYLGASDQLIDRTLAAHESAAAHETPHETDPPRP